MKSKTNTLLAIVIVLLVVDVAMRLSPREATAQDVEVLPLGARPERPIYIALVDGTQRRPFYVNAALPLHATPAMPLYLNTAIVGKMSSPLPVHVAGSVDADVRGGVTVYGAQ